MTEIKQADLFTSDSDSGSSDSGFDSEILSSETDVDSAGSLRDFVVDGDENGDGEFLPDSETVSVASMGRGRRLQISDALDFVILELIRLRDLLHEGDATGTGESGTDT